MLHLLFLWSLNRAHLISPPLRRSPLVALSQHFQSNRPTDRPLGRARPGWYHWREFPAWLISRLESTSISCQDFCSSYVILFFSTVRCCCWRYPWPVVDGWAFLTWKGCDGMGNSLFMIFIFFREMPPLAGGLRACLVVWSVFVEIFRNFGKRGSVTKIASISYFFLLLERCWNLSTEADMPWLLRPAVDQLYNNRYIHV